MKALLVAAAAGLAGATTYMAEKFEDGWEKRWTVGSEWKKAEELGEWKWTGGKYPGAEGDKGIQTGTDARFYSLSAPLDKAFDNGGKDLVLSYTVKFENDMDCHGAYLKLLPGGFDQKKFGGDTDYSIMFGPDICGYGTRKTHLIFNYKGKNLLSKKSIKVETDKLSHRYTLILRPDNTYEVQIDGARVEGGKLDEDWDFLAPRRIKDPNAKKPADWVDAAQIPDPEDKKPEGWDDAPAKIPDPKATKPDSWDEEDDGVWEPPLIDNPEYKGEWKPKMIANPAYKGPWVHPEIDNPDFKEDPELYHVCKPCEFAGFELWQVKAGSLFDDIIVTDSLAEAEEFAKATFLAKKDAEKAAFDAAEEAKKKADAAAAEEAKKTEEADDEEEDDDEDKEEL